MDFDFSASVIFWNHFHTTTHFFLYQVLQMSGIDIHWFLFCGCFRLRKRCGIFGFRLHESSLLLCLADIHPHFDDKIVEFLLSFSVRQTQNGSGVSTAESSLGDFFLNLGRKLQQSQGVRDRCTSFADSRGDILLRERELLH